MQQAGHAFLKLLPAMCAEPWPHAVAQSLQAAMQAASVWFRCSLIVMVPNEDGEDSQSMIITVT